ncbi:HtaA domain-containing protein [Actinosynnema sp.]|uniref:HtaA domain-containing protein n=1 Tax=Actinosynnema sp. TaxID=1872144 RepID=UPI003F849FCD
MAEQDGVVDETGGPGLRWAIKRSFVDYVLRMPDGRAGAGEGAHPLEGGEIRYEAGEPREVDGALVLPFRGDVRFAGHFGMLYVRIADPEVTIRDGKAELTIADPYLKSEERTRLVTFTAVPLDAGPGESAWSASDVVLAPEGVELFNDVYQAGEPFEPLEIRVPAP